MMTTEMLKKRISTENHVLALFSRINLPTELLAARLGIDHDTLLLMKTDEAYRASSASFPLQFCLESLALLGENSLGLLPFFQKGEDYSIEKNIIIKQPFFNDIKDHLDIPADFSLWSYPQVFFLEVLTINELYNGRPLIISENGFNSPLKCLLKGQKIVVTLKEEPDYIKDVESTFHLNNAVLKSIRKIMDTSDLIVSQHLARQCLSLFLRQLENPAKAIRVKKKNKNKWDFEAMSFFQKPVNPEGFTIFIGNNDPLQCQEVLSDMAYQVATAI